MIFLIVDLVTAVNTSGSAVPLLLLSLKVDDVDFVRIMSRKLPSSREKGGVINLLRENTNLTFSLCKSLIMTNHQRTQ